MSSQVLSKSPQRFFVTGTDTDAGKTYCSTALLRGLLLCGTPATALKPIASGVDIDGFNPDAKALAAATNQQIPAVNPLCFEIPTAPHLAASALRQSLSLAQLDQLLPQHDSQIELIEGAGGWLLPLNADEYLADWVVRHQWPVLLIVGVKLGCLNHSLLTVRELRRAGVPLLGYIANVLTPQMHYLEATLADLAQRLQLPLLGTVPFSPQGADDALCIDLATALKTQLAAIPASA